MRRPQECPETNLGAYMRERDHTGPDTTNSGNADDVQKGRTGRGGKERKKCSSRCAAKKKERERESSTEDTSSAPLLPGFMTYKTAILSRCARGFHTVSIARALFRTHTHATRDAHDGRCCSLFFKRMEEETKNSRTHPSTTHIQ